MAPKASASFKQEDQCPILKLVMEKGPLSGRIMEFEPGSSIRVGRIVRGNTVSIKDAGISSKHLLIQAEPASDVGFRRWTVTDLGSSNGTSLNGSQLDSSIPAVLTDGDVIKIGETTAIRVEFEVNDGGGECDSGIVRRNLRRRGKNGRVELGVIDENSELGHEGNDQKNRYDLKGSCMIGKDEVLGNYNGILVAENEGKVKGRRTRGSKARDLGTEVEEFEEVVEISRKASVRRTRTSKDEENLENLEIKIDENEGASDNVDEVEGKGGRNGGLRSTRSSKKDEKLFEELKETRGVGLQRASNRTTRSSRKVESLDESSVDYGVIIKGKSTRKGSMGKIGSYVEAPLELKAEDELAEKGIDSGREEGAGFASMPEAEQHMSKTEDSAVDLEKMKLGEWFEFLEAHMPEQIIQVTEEMITEMEQKAEKLHEFMLHMNNAKEKMKITLQRRYKNAVVDSSRQKQLEIFLGLRLFKHFPSAIIHPLHVPSRPFGCFLKPVPSILSHSDGGADLLSFKSKDLIWVSIFMFVVFKDLLWHLSIWVNFIQLTERSTPSIIIMPSSSDCWIADSSFHINFKASFRI